MSDGQGGVEALREVVSRLTASACALAALGAELQARAGGRRIDPAIRPHIELLLQRSGVAAALEGLSADELRPFIGEIRHLWDIDGALLAAPDRAVGWSYDDEILVTAGAATSGFARVLPRIAPLLDGLAPALAAHGARFLDIGCGVGGLSIAMAQQFPTLGVVGIDRFAPSLAIARGAVAAAGVGERVELREQAGEDLADEASYDLAWIPAPFMTPEVLARVVERVHGALKPGGWLLFASARPSDDAAGAAMALRVANWGGRTATAEEIGALLGRAGFADVRTLPSPPRDFKMIVAARRPAAAPGR